MSKSMVIPQKRPHPSTLYGAEASLFKDEGDQKRRKINDSWGSLSQLVTGANIETPTNNQLTRDNY